ncbi:MAG: phytanoyl-CoA dioxygenase family protein [Pseudomonadota bacterium]
MPERSLTSAQLSRYRQEGFLVVEDLFDDDLVQQIQAVITRTVEEKRSEIIQWESVVTSGDYTPASPELGVRKLFRMACHHPFFRDLASHEGMVDVAQSVLGPGVSLMQSMLLMKPPHIGGEKVWHQDNAYFRLTPANVLGFWVALDEATVNNGCMHVIHRSHLEGLAEHVGEGDAYGLSRPPLFSEATAIAMNPGDALLFHGELWHGTPANQSEQPRRALQYHYVANHCVAGTEGSATGVRKAELLIAGELVEGALMIAP